MKIIYSTLQKLYDKLHPEIVTYFYAIYYHQDVVSFFVPKNSIIWPKNHYHQHYDTQLIAKLTSRYKIYLLSYELDNFTFEEIYN